MDFAAWMKSQRYRESTIHQTQSDLRGALNGSTDPNVLNALRRYSTFAVENQIEDQLTALAVQHGVGVVKRLPKAKQRRKLTAVSFQDEDWTALQRAVQNSSDPRDQVLWAMTTNALRVGDVLRVDRKTLQALVLEPSPILLVEVKGGVTREVPLGVIEPWAVLAQGVLKSKAKTIAQYVCPGAVGDVRGSCAYHRVNRRLKALQRQLGLAGRANLHRIRRTIAVQTLEQTDLLTTQQMLGHTSQLSTQKYVDEANHRKIARIQRRLAGLE